MGSKELDVHLTDEAADAIAKMATITRRQPDEVLTDALRTYLWVLREQAQRRKVISVNGGPAEESELEPLVQDEKAAEQYFRTLDWWDR